jgi:hypothetical protein
MRENGRKSNLTPKIAKIAGPKQPKSRFWLKKAGP